MPVNKNALARYHIIDSCLTNKQRKYPTLLQLREKVNEKLGLGNVEDDGISDSTIKSDFRDMEELWGTPIEYNNERRGYEYTEEDFSIKQFPLTGAEIEALDFSSAILDKLKGSDLYADFESAINKVINGYRIKDFAKKSEKQILQAEEPIKTMGNQWMQVLLRNITTDKKCLEIEYQSYERTLDIHQFSSYFLKEYNKRWYVFGYSHNAIIEKSKGKIFPLALERIQSIKRSNIPYHRDPNFSEEDYFKHCIGFYKEENAKPEKVRLLFNKFQGNYVISQPWHKEQKHKRDEASGNVEVELGVYINYEIEQKILALGQQVKVLEPESLKSTIVQILKENLKQYEG